MLGISITAPLLGALKETETVCPSEEENGTRCIMNS